MTLRSEPYRLGRLELAYLSAGEYLRRLWFIALPVPLGGVLGLIFLPGLAVVWFVAILWPLSLPARAILASRRAARMFTAGCHLEADDDGLTFLGESSDIPQLRWRLPWSEIRSVVVRPRHVVLVLRRFEIAPIARAALSPEAVAWLDHKVSEGPLAADSHS